MTKALAKEPDGRYETCYQLVEATRSALGLETKPSRWPFAVAAVGIALIGAALLAFVLTQGGATVKAEPGADSLVRIDPQTNKVTKTMPVGRKASGVAAAGDFVWVTNAGDGTVWRIDPKTGTTLKVAVAAHRLASPSDTWCLSRTGRSTGCCDRPGEWIGELRDGASGSLA
jgi:streptogramin lyase